MLKHVQCYLAALLDHTLLVLAVALEDLRAGVLADGAQSLGTLVPHHGVLVLLLKCRPQLGNAGLVLDLTQDVANLVSEQGTAALQT